MYKIDLRLKTLFPAIIGTRDKHSDIEFRVIAENGIDIDKNAAITITDVANDIYGVENIYAYKDNLIIEVKRDPDEDDFDEDDCSTDEMTERMKAEVKIAKKMGIIKGRKETAEKIYCVADEICTGGQNDRDKILAMIKEQYGVKVEE